MTRGLRSARDLVAAGLIAPSDVVAIARVAARYAVALTPTVVAAIDRADPADPIARQYLPDAAELDTRAGEIPDPIGDAAHSPVKGVVHRYPDRVLIQPTLVCPVYCRFCFRREVVGPGGGSLTEAELAAAVEYVRARPAIREAILTGGDPLILSPRRLGALVEALSAIPHLDLIRIHSRVPVADPARVAPGLIAALRASKPVWLGVHVNCARELGAEAQAALARLADAGIPLVSQTVLLRGVNDSAEALAELFCALVRNRVKPYYLHHLDPAPGTARFRVPLEEGLALMRALRGRVSGLALPTYVLDIEGGWGKVPLGPAYLADDAVADPWGASHRRPD